MMTGGLLAIVGWVVGVPRLANLWPSNLLYRDIPDLPPFRELETAGQVSAAGGMLVGLDQPATPDPAQLARIATARANPCAALFGPQTDPRLPVAIFTDFNCPNCRVLEAILHDYDAANPDTIRIIRHELPLLGAASTIASQAVLAAAMQGGYDAMQARLMRSRGVSDPNQMASLAEQVGLNGQRLLTDMQSPQVAATLANSRAIASVFGFYGTPSTVIGRTVFIGAISATDVAQIITAERAAPPLTCNPA